MSEKTKFIKQDGLSWNPNFFIGMTEKEAIKVIKKGSPQIAESTVIAVWKQANNKSTPNKPVGKNGATTED
jgi:hypothetical protein